MDMISPHSIVRTIIIILYVDLILTLVFINYMQWATTTASTTMHHAHSPPPPLCTTSAPYIPPPPSISHGHRHAPRPPYMATTTTTVQLTYNPIDFTYSPSFLLARLFVLHPSTSTKTSTHQLVPPPPPPSPPLMQYKLHNVAPAYVPVPPEQHPSDGYKLHLHICTGGSYPVYNLYWWCFF